MIRARACRNSVRSSGCRRPRGRRTSPTTRGYTGQEEIPAATTGLSPTATLVNYNARLYDPNTGRFLSPDPLLASIGTGPDGFNAYEYVNDNPLAATDPTGMKCHGWFGCTFGSFGEAALGIAVAVILEQPEFLAWEGAVGISGAGSAFVAGAAAGAVGSGFSSWQAPLIGGLEGAAFFQVGSWTDGHFYDSGIKGIGLTNGNETFAAWANSPQFAENIVGHGLVGGLASVAEGGSFLSAGFSDAAGPVLALAGADGVAEESVAGGVGSVLGGGKFANGAETGAFGYLFNQVAPAYMQHPIQPVELSSVDPGYAEPAFDPFALAVGGGVATSIENFAAEAGAADSAIGSFSPINPGPLADDIASTFRSGTYQGYTLDSDTTLFRVIGDNGNPNGAFWTATEPSGPLQSVIDSALDQSWGNSATTTITRTFPAGTQVFEGAAAPQGGLVGGGSQFYIPGLSP